MARPVTSNQYCVIAASYNTSGDSGLGPPPFPYLACCGPLTPASYACCCGCNVADAPNFCCACCPCVDKSRKCRAEQPLLEVPCPLVCAVWPAVYPLALLCAWGEHLLCEKAGPAGGIYGKCCPTPRGTRRTERAIVSVFFQ